MPAARRQARLCAETNSMGIFDRLITAQRFSGIYIYIR
jgi:hypothetical protein